MEMFLNYNWCCLMNKFCFTDLTLPNLNYKLKNSFDSVGV